MVTVCIVPVILALVLRTCIVLVSTLFFIITSAFYGYGSDKLF